MLSEATSDQLIELPVVGPTRAQQFLQLREEAGGKVAGSWLRNVGGVDWEGLADSGKIVFKGEGANMGLLGWVGKKGVSGIGQCARRGACGHGKATSKINGEVDSNVGARLLKHELQLQLMAENMKGIMQGDKEEEVGQRSKLPTFDGTSEWGPYYKQAVVIFEMNNCADPKWRAFKIIKDEEEQEIEVYSEP